MLKTVRDLGMPFYEKNFENGNLYLVFNIIFPTSLDATQRETVSKVKFFYIYLYKGSCQSNS